MINLNKATTSNYGIFMSGWYYQDRAWAAKTVAAAPDRYTLLSPQSIQVDVGGLSLQQFGPAYLDLSLTNTWDTISGTNYTTAANRAGKDFYIYACQPTYGTLPTLKVSANATTPTGYTATTSRKIGGFHCLCVAVGTIANHTLTGYLAGDILPQSVWDLNNRAESENEGMVFDSKTSAWVDIYLFTGTGTTTTSVNGASYADTVTQYNLVDYAAVAKKRLLFDHEFTSCATGCNEGTNVTESAEQNTTTGHVDTAARRMISNIGCEDCAGVLWQWLNDSLTSDDGSTSWAWKDVTGSRGQVYSQGTYGYYKLIAGGGWYGGTNCGSRSRGLNIWAWRSDSGIGGRALSSKRVRVKQRLCG
jgi:hypothetical protein